MEIQFYTTSHEAWEAELAHIALAKHTIDLETFIFLDDALGKRFLTALSLKAAQGVRVRCIFDAMGSIWLSRGTINSCRKNGIEVELFHRIIRSKRRLPFWKRVLERTHRKALIIDGYSTHGGGVAFVGGVNVEEAHKNWRDLQLKLTGDAVKPIQETFEKTWGYLQNNYFKRLTTRLEERLQKMGARLSIDVWLHEPNQESQSFRKLFKHLLKKARSDILLVTPYFFPSAPFLKYMRQAVKRGVRVRLLAPWTTEVKWTVPLMREYVRLAARLGIEVKSAGEPLMHAKAFLIDDSWGVVGSANINHRSLLFDRELSIVIGEGPHARELKKILDRWWEDGKPLTKHELHRPLKEWFAGLPARVLRRFI